MPQDGWLTEPREGWGRVATAVSVRVCDSDCGCDKSVDTGCVDEGNAL